MRNIRGLPTVDELAGMIALALTEHGQPPAELSVTMSRVPGLWTDVAGEHIEFGPFEAAARLLVRLQFGEIIWPPDPELTKAVVARYFNACQMAREAEVIQSISTAELLDMEGVAKGAEHVAIYEDVVSRLRRAQPAAATIDLDRDLLPLASAADKIAAVGCSTSALGGEAREGAREIVAATMETLRELGFAEVRPPIDHMRHPGEAEERCRQWPLEVGDIDLYVGIVLASSSGVTGEMYEVTDGGGLVMTVMPLGLEEPCGHLLGRFLDGPRVEYGSLRDLPALLSVAVRDVLVVDRTR